MTRFVCRPRLRGVAVALIKIASDMRWLASGPRYGLGELKLPQNEPGSSIMPSKVDSTQREAIVLISIQVIGEDLVVAFARSQGNFELNAIRPIVIDDVLRFARILADGAREVPDIPVEDTHIANPHGRGFRPFPSRRLRAHLATEILRQACDMHP